MFAEVFGDEPPRVLALHGWGRRGADFKQSLANLPALALDLPGFGASPVPDRVIGADGYADIVAQVLDQFDGPPVLVGHSFGGRVGVCLAAEYPDSVGPLVLTGVPLLRRAPAGKPALGYRVVRRLHRLGVISDEWMEAEKQKRGSPDYRAASGVMRDILVKVVNEEYPDQLRRLVQPVTMIWGAGDTEVPVETAEKAQELIVGAGGTASVETVDGVGHLLPLEAPEILRRVIDSVLCRGFSWRHVSPPLFRRVSAGCVWRRGSTISLPPPADLPGGGGRLVSATRLCWGYR